MRHRGEPGIKAIIIYPMNALATDQAKRIARLIHDNPNLKNQMKAGLYIGGQQGDKAFQVMGPEHLITDRETLRLSPPAILLTNYKMLDYLLIRPRDFFLWKENRPGTLKFLVVDEIHTFDGAQGTDLACLIRRLKSRLKMEQNSLCCVGTSVTLGEGDDRRVCLYADKVFGETFGPEAVITESLVTAESADEEDLWQDNACLRFSCQGSYEREKPSRDYYGQLYATGDVKRIFTTEHTGLLKREKRETLEKRFMAEDLSPGSPNLLSCTPTLELGIDIGDLSSVILCSVPPAQANYMQRIGRSGRKNGNAFNLTVANGRPHDLYFYAEPKAMIAGNVETPGCFLNAPAVLERQMTAFCFDRWIESGIPVTAIPDHLGQVLGQFGNHRDKKKFPLNLIGYLLHPILRRQPQRASR
jgi:ATP-dependent helicase YprA (DUF1998 family)